MLSLHTVSPLLVRLLKQIELNLRLKMHLFFCEKVHLINLVLSRATCIKLFQQKVKLFYLSIVKMRLMILKGFCSSICGVILLAQLR